MRLEAALRGDLERHMKAAAKAAGDAVVTGTRRATVGLKHEMRAQVTGADLGHRLANSWRGRAFENRKLDAAGRVWTNAPTIMRAFDEGVTINSRDGLWLAIPTQAAPRRGVGGRRISPSNFPEHRFGPLRFVYRGSGKPSLLVVDNQRARGGKRGGFAKAGKRARATGQGLTTVVMFVMVPQVRLRKRLDFAAAGARWQRCLPRLIVNSWHDSQG
ncbi:MAG: DUF6441 family protein [Alphaproteobacteria bacterium]|jgi:hypothetical protein|nr:DUF6441 family protein [Alphaproteobacteria bacterium]